MIRVCSGFTHASVCALLLLWLPVNAQMLSPAQASMPVRSVWLNDSIIELTLEDAVYLGLRGNRNIRSAYLERIAQKFDLRVEEDRFRPKLALSARHLASRNQDGHLQQTELTPQATLLTPIGTRLSLSWSRQASQPGQGGRIRTDGASLTLIQPLLRGGGREVAGAPLRMARLGEQVNLLNLKTTVADTITRIITSYREVLRAQEQLQIARDALERSQQLLAANQAMIDAGRMAAFEIVQTEADAASQELGVEEAANQLDASRLELLRLLALDLHTSIRAADTLDAQRIDVSLDQALHAAREQQPAWLMQLIAAEQSAINLALARNDRLWEISLIGGGSQARRHDRAAARAGERTWDGYLGIQMEIPIGDLSRRQAEVRARVEAENQQIRLTEARQLLERDVGDAVRDLGTRWRQYEIAQRARELSRRKLEIEREKLQAGRSSNFQVISFESDLRNAENARLNALISYLNAQTTLDATLGTTLESWEIDLND